MSADPAEEGVLLAEFDNIFDAPPLRPAVDDLVAMDVVADLAEISQPLPTSPITSAESEFDYATGLAGIEPTAYRLGGDRSILLSYSPKQQLIVSDY
jgi:hypothetical protein